MSENRPPKEVTEPPEGYEWTGECEAPQDWFAVWFSEINKWKAFHLRDYFTARPHPILRRVKPPTVTVELLRSDAKAYAANSPSPNGHDRLTDRLSEACRLALQAEDSDAD